jgi:hypothetical protein
MEISSELVGINQSNENEEGDAVLNIIDESEKMLFQALDVPPKSEHSPSGSPKHFVNFL